MTSFIPPNKLPTGDSAVGNPTRYSFIAPSDLWVFTMIAGMLYDYSQVDAWVQEGTATIDDAAAIFAALYDSFGVDMLNTGVIVPYAGGILPLGWLPCDGRSLLRADFPELFSVIGTVYGSADSTHFNIPDLRGVMPIGQGTSAGTGTVYNLGGTGGEETHTLVTAEIPSHAHTDAGHTHSESTAAPNVTTIGAGAPEPTAVPSVGITGSGSASIQPTGGDGAHENRPPFLGVNYAIIT